MDPKIIINLQIAGEKNKIINYNSTLLVYSQIPKVRDTAILYGFSNSSPKHRIDLKRWGWGVEAICRISTFFFHIDTCTWLYKHIINIISSSFEVYNSIDF